MCRKGLAQSLTRYFPWSNAVNDCLVAMSLLSKIMLAKIWGSKLSFIAKRIHPSTHVALTSKGEKFMHAYVKTSLNGHSLDLDGSWVSGCLLAREKKVQSNPTVTDLKGQKFFSDNGGPLLLSIYEIEKSSFKGQKKSFPL